MTTNKSFRELQSTQGVAAVAENAKTFKRLVAEKGVQAAVVEMCRAGIAPSQEEIERASYEAIRERSPFQSAMMGLSKDVYSSAIAGNAREEERRRAARLPEPDREAEANPFAGARSRVRTAEGAK